MMLTLSLLGTLLLHPVTLEIVVPPMVRLGEAVPITLRLTNTSRNPVNVYLQGRPTAFDIIVSRGDGTVVWRRLERAVISTILQVRPLAAGESLEFSDLWSQQSNLGERVPPGAYSVSGVLPGDPPAELRTQSVPLHILP
jgi:hypothetical protein